MDSTNRINSEWKDKFSVVRTTIPNYLFGISSKVVESKKDPFGDFEKNKKDLSENKPTIADVKYMTTYKDLKYSRNGKPKVIDTWFDISFEALFGEPKTKKKKEIKKVKTNIFERVYKKIFSGSDKE